MAQKNYFIFKTLLLIFVCSGYISAYSVPCTSSDCSTSSASCGSCTSSDCSTNSASCSSCTSSNCCTSTSKCEASCTTTCCSCCKTTTSCKKCCDCPPPTTTPPPPTPPPPTPPAPTTTTTPSREFKCPSSTFWNGVSCQTTINIRNEIHNPTNIVATNENKVIIYEGRNATQIQSSSIPTPPPPTTTTTLRPPRPLCCYIIAPRQCSLRRGWICANQRYYLCGRYCTNSVIRLRATRIFFENQILVMPPKPDGITKCGKDGIDCSEDVIDCSGCISGGICSPYCYNYDCEGEDCNYIDHGEFCQTYGLETVCNNKICFEDSCKNRTIVNNG